MPTLRASTLNPAALPVAKDFARGTATRQPGDPTAGKSFRVELGLLRSAHANTPAKLDLLAALDEWVDYRETLP